MTTVVYLHTVVKVEFKVIKYSSYGVLFHFLDSMSSKDFEVPSPIFFSPEERDDIMDENMIIEAFYFEVFLTFIHFHSHDYEDVL